MIATGLQVTTWATIAIWSMFPSIWLLSKINLISIAQEVFILILADISSKSVFGVVLLYAFCFSHGIDWHNAIYMTNKLLIANCT